MSRSTSAVMGIAIFILAGLLGLGLFLVLNNNAFADQAIITPVSPNVTTAPTVQPSVAVTPQLN